MTNEIMFGFWLKQRRKSLGLTQDDLARRVGCACITIQKIEASDRLPSRQLAERLAHYLEIAPEECSAFLAWARREQPGGWPIQSAGVAQQALGHISNRPQSNLPTPLTSLIGRECEAAALRALVLRESVHLLTTTGAPGIGKTRLAIQVALELQDAFADGVFFVALASIREPDLVATSIAQVLGLREAGNRTSWEILRDALRNKQRLLLLDNFEQVLTAAPPLAELLMYCPHLKLLVTSRAVLNLSGEHEFVVPSLALPDMQELPPAAVLAQYAAIDLFVRRTQAHKPHFALTEVNALAVAEICVRLDGLPLAIELAAARGKLFAPQALLARLTSRLRLLTGGAHDLPMRQRTIRSTIDWSYDLLDASEQALFRRLGAFVGGCTLEAVEARYGSPGLAVEQGRRHVVARSSVLDGLTALVDRSLLRQVEVAGGEPRFVMLETIREYALDQLVIHRELDVVRQHYAQFFLALAEEAELKLRGPEQVAWLDRLEQDHDNMRAALSWSLEHGQIAIGLRLAGALASFWEVRGYFSEGHAWLKQVLERAPERTAARAKALQGLGFFVSHQKDHNAARTCYAASLAIYRELNDKKGTAEVLTRLGELVHEQSGFTTARTLFEESLGLYRALEDKAGIARALNGLGVVARDTEDYAAAHVFVGEGLALYHEIGDQFGVAWLLYRLGTLAYHQGDRALERRCYEESLALRRRLGDKLGVAYALNNLGNIVSDEKDYIKAQACYVESLTLYQELGDKPGIAMILFNLGELMRMWDDNEQAAIYTEESLMLYRELADNWRIAITLHNLGHVSNRLGDYQRATTLFQESLVMHQAIEDRFGVALCLAGLAGVAGREGHAARAARLFGASESLHSICGKSMCVSERIEYDHNITVVRAQLDDVMFEAMRASGQGLSIEQIVACALSEE